MSSVSNTKNRKIRIYFTDEPEGYCCTVPINLDLEQGCEFLWQDALSKEHDSNRFTSLIDGGKNRDIPGVERTARLSQAEELHGALLY